MKLNTLSQTKRNLQVAAICIAIGCVELSATSLLAQTAPANISPGLQEVVKLTQAHMSDDVVLSYVKNSGASFTLSADDILYLNSQGVSQPVISALLQNKPAAVAVAPTPPPAPVVPVAEPTTPAPPPQPDVQTAPPGSEVNLPYFQSQLAPYGTWMDVPGYGLCWMPSVAASVPDWRPYDNAGHWVYTDDGWYWQSDYPWGDIAFHYGRWTKDLRYGWLWTPDYTWGPAWVAWRHAEGAGYVGWAPLPVDARFEAGVGLTFHGRVAADIDFGLAPSMFTFVDYNHFWAPDIHLYVAPLWRVPTIFRASIVLNNYRFAGGRFIIEGIGHERIAALTHHEVRVERVEVHDARIAHDRDVRISVGRDARDGRPVGHDAGRLAPGRPGGLSPFGKEKDGGPGR